MFLGKQIEKTLTNKLVVCIVYEQDNEIMEVENVDMAKKILDTQDEETKKELGTKIMVFEKGRSQMELYKNELEAKRNGKQVSPPKIYGIYFGATQHLTEYSSKESAEYMLKTVPISLIKKCEMKLMVFNSNKELQDFKKEKLKLFPCHCPRDSNNLLTV